MTKQRILLLLLAALAIAVWSCLESPDPHFSKQIQGPITFTTNPAQPFVNPPVYSDAFDALSARPVGEVWQARIFSCAVHIPRS